MYSTETPEMRGWIKRNYHDCVGGKAAEILRRETESKLIQNKKSNSNKQKKALEFHNSEYI